MTTLYVANLKRQTEHFTFRIKVGENAYGDKPHRFPIEPGSQLRIPLKLDMDQVHAIIAQHEVYGFTAAEAVPKATYMAGLCYSIDKPITGVQIDLGFQHNDEVLMEDAAESRRTATAAVAADLEEKTRGTLKHFQQEQSEVPEVPGQTPSIDETIEVAPPGNEPSRGRRRRTEV